jgi:hypothetical protein
MRNLLALGALALLVFAAVGYFLGWYSVKTDPTADGHRQVTIDVNSTKISEDLSKSKAKLHNMLENKGPANPGSSTGSGLPNLPPPPDSWARPEADPDGIQVPPAPVIPGAPSTR